MSKYRELRKYLAGERTVIREWMDTYPEMAGSWRGYARALGTVCSKLSREDLDFSLEESDAVESTLWDSGSDKWGGAAAAQLRARVYSQAVELGLVMPVEERNL